MEQARQNSWQLLNMSCTPKSQRKHNHLLTINGSNWQFGHCCIPHFQHKQFITRASCKYHQLINEHKIQYSVKYRKSERSSTSDVTTRTQAKELRITKFFKANILKQTTTNFCTKPIRLNIWTIFNTPGEAQYVHPTTIRATSYKVETHILLLWIWYAWCDCSFLFFHFLVEFPFANSGENRNVKGCPFSFQ